MFVEIEGVSGRAPTLVNPEHVVSITRPGNYTAIHLVDGSEVNTDLDPKAVAMRLENAAPTIAQLIAAVQRGA